MAELKYININYPFKNSPKGFFLDLNLDENAAIKADLMHLILTRKGQRLYNPDFGTDLLRYIFEPEDGLTLSKIKEEIDTAVNRYLPKLKVVNVELTELKEDVWDLSVYDDTHCFRLSGVVTGNCGEILLGEKSFCNLVTTNLAKFNGRFNELLRAHWIIARANYRQTCVDFRDGILQSTWHELNQFLRLTGVGCAGIVMWEHQNNPKEIKKLRRMAHEGVDLMAMELNLPKSKAVTTVKPDGTVGKMMDTTEGIHRPLSKYIINNIIVFDFFH